MSIDVGTKAADMAATIAINFTKLPDLKISTSPLLFIFLNKELDIREIRAAIESDQ